MEPQKRIASVLHDEHMASVALLNRLESVLLDNGPNAPPAVGEGEMARLLADVSAAVQDEIGRHFTFEENELFPRLAEWGDADIGTLLKEEHETILPVGQQLAAMIGAARAEGFTMETWEPFRELGLELIERMIAHIQKEEMGLLPVLEDILDEDTDADLANRYALGA
ncbi:MAG: hemerythrin domain-containing protein [Alphaproteobacteria bacterium]|nr:hemerythrin domain-containing protein [Alphaproteobacteria bacterium]